MKTKNPLRRRLKRELAQDIKKYIALFIMLTVTIGATAAMYVANGSMETSLKENYDNYNVEDGHFALRDKPARELLDRMEEEGIRLSEQYCKELPEDFDADGTDDGEVRVFVIREDMNRICVLDGALPTASDEIAIDRMHADNSGVKIGDSICVNKKKLKVTGLVSFSDYTALYRKNSDLMFDSISFEVAAVTRDCYETLGGSEKYEYAFRYNTRPADDREQKALSDELIPKLATLAATGGYLDDQDKALDLKERMATGAITPQEYADIQEYSDRMNEIKEYVPEYANQAIRFAPNDFGNDKAMMETLLVILVGVLAFIFAITASNTIVNESAVIGTLRASGYSRFELVRHYLAIPILVTVISAVVGNLLGYLVFKDVVVSMYYNSYSLPTYTTRWSAEALVRTTLIPVGIMIVINIVVISVKMRFTPLQFLRRDLSGRRKKKAIRLPDISFLGRFRIRIFLHNAAGYLVMFIGILFVNVLMCFAVGLPSTLKNYQNNARNLLIADHQYVLTESTDKDGNPVTTAEPTAERYCMTSLNTTSEPHVGESISIYGFVDDSRYFRVADEVPEGETNVAKKPAPGTVLVTKSFAEKFSLEVDETVVLKEEFTDKTYDFRIDGLYDMPGTLGVLMPLDEFNRTFGNEEGSFTGYLSDTPITDIDDDLIAADITAEDVLRVVQQLDHSLGGYMTYFEVVCILIAVVIIYLLTKLMVERNAVSISMAKVLGYTTREINGLYIRITTGVVVVSAIAGLFLSIAIMSKVWQIIMYRFNGWFAFDVNDYDMLKMLLMTLISYGVVVLFDMRRVRRIPLTEALKNVE